MPLGGCLGVEAGDVSLPRHLAWWSDGSGLDPGRWDLVLLLRENIREAERRMELDVLMSSS